MRTRLREMTPADVPAVLDRLREQNERDGTAYFLPQIFDKDGKRLPNIPLALVAVDVDSGQVEQGHVWERTIEHTAYGISARATVCSMEEQDAVAFILREHGYRDEHIFVPEHRVSSMAHGLERIYGMSQTGLTHFYRMLDPQENAAVQKFYQDQKQDHKELEAANV